MRILWFVLVTLVLVIEVGYAENSDRKNESSGIKKAFECSSKKNDPSLLEKVQAQYNTLQGLTAQFEQDSFLNALDTSETSRGKMYFLRPGSMKWIYEAPERQEFLVKENTVWLYQPIDNQVIVDKFSDMLLTDLPVGFLMGVGDLSKSFTLKSACDTSEGTLLQLEGKGEKAKSLKSFSLLVNKESFFPIGARVVDEAGNITSIRFLEEELNPTLDSKLFTPNFPKGVDIQQRGGE